jgi:hypothetical protein
VLVGFGLGVFVSTGLGGADVALAATTAVLLGSTTGTTGVVTAVSCAIAVGCLVGTGVSVGMGVSVGVLVGVGV